MKTLSLRLSKYSEQEYLRENHDVLPEHLNLPIVGKFYQEFNESKETYINENFILKDDNFFYIYSEKWVNETPQMSLYYVFIKTQSAFKELIMDNIIHSKTDSANTLNIYTEFNKL